MSDVIKIDTSQIARLAKSFPGAERVAAEEMLGAMHGSVAHLQEQVQGRTPVGVSGDLKKSIIQRVYGSPVALFGEVSTPLLYGAPIEFGRKPGKMPPVDALELWVIRKLGISQDSRGVAYVIARAIARRGIKAVGMFSKGLEAAMPGIHRLWQATEAKIAARIESELGK